MANQFLKTHKVVLVLPENWAKKIHTSNERLISQQQNKRLKVLKYVYILSFIGETKALQLNR